MKATAPNITPLAELPEYAQAQGKLQQYVAELSKAKDEASRLENLRLQAANPKPVNSAEDALTRADALLAGGGTARSLAEQWAHNESIMIALKKAIEVQEAVVSRIVGEASANAAKLLRDEHRKAVGKTVAALEALVQANAQERGFHDLLRRNGYSDMLPTLEFQPLNDSMDPTDRYGGYTPTWWTDASNYVNNDITPNEAWPAKCAAEVAESAQRKAMQEAQRRAVIDHEEAEIREALAVGVEKFKAWAARHS